MQFDHKQDMRIVDRGRHQLLYISEFVLLLVTITHQPHIRLSELKIRVGKMAGK